MALLDALVQLEDWPALQAVLRHTHKSIAGNALLAPFRERATGLMAAAFGDTDAAAKHLVRARDAFDHLKQRHEAARTRAAFAVLTSAEPGDPARHRAQTQPR